MKVTASLGTCTGEILSVPWVLGALTSSHTASSGQINEDTLRNGRVVTIIMLFTSTFSGIINLIRDTDLCQSLKVVLGELCVAGVLNHSESKF